MPLLQVARATNAPGRLDRRGKMLLGLIVGGFAAVRLACLSNDLWLDEIWSINSVTALHSPGEIFTRYLHDNNHPLNSLWIYLWRPARMDWVYRLLSWLTGSATIGVAGLIAACQFRQLNPAATLGQIRAASLITATLVGASYLLTLYSSEARGYAPALGFGLLAFYVLLRAAGKTWSTWAILYWCLCGLGLMSHAVAGQVILGGMAWSIAALWRESSRGSERLATLAWWHAVPLASGALYYAWFLQRIAIGGGPRLSLLQVLGELGVYTFGFPSNWGGVVGLLVLAGATLVALYQLGRRDAAIAAFYSAAVIVVPAAGLSASRFSHLAYPRYFIVSATGALLLSGYLLASFWGRSWRLRILCLAIILLFTGGNAIHTIQLIRYGRGQYRQAIRYIADHTTTQGITLCSDQDFRNSMLINYYAPREFPERPVRYLARNQQSKERPQWLLVHRFELMAAFDRQLFDDRGNDYILEAVFRHAPLSGWDWAVYRNQRRSP